MRALRWDARWVWLRAQKRKTPMGNGRAQWSRCTDAAFGHGMPCPYENIRIGHEPLLSRSLANGGIIRLYE